MKYWFPTRINHVFARSIIEKACQHSIASFDPSILDRIVDVNQHGTVVVLIL